MDYPVFGCAELYCVQNSPDDEMIILWAYQLVKALKYCHNEHKIVHGYLRPCNPEQQLYAAPETLPSREQVEDPSRYPICTSVNRYTFSSDIWSFAMCLYYIKHLRTPNEKVELHRLREQLEDGIRPVLKEDLNPTLIRLIKACWRTEKRDSSGDVLPLEQRRPNADAILNFLDYN